MRESLDIVLADNHVAFLDALTAVLTPVGHHIVATAETRSELIGSIRALQPNLCITDSHFPDGDGVAAIDEITATSPDTMIVILTDDENPETLRRALAAGAVGYMHKSRGLPVLLKLLGQVSNGEIVIAGSFSPLRTAEPPAPTQLRLLAAYLTPRELECLALLAAGLDTKVISHRLSVSITTARSHIQSVLTKLGVHSRVEAASLAIRHNLIDTTTAQTHTHAVEDTA
jgi:two-component system nitrate/nitrite response regulator NarL